MGTCQRVHDASPVHTPCIPASWTLPSPSSYSRPLIGSTLGFRAEMAGWSRALMSLLLLDHGLG